MKILITGSDGLLGHDLSKTIKDKGFELIKTNHGNLDITDKIKVKEIFQKTKPDLIINLAAYTNVDRAEIEVEKVKKVNIEGVKNIIKETKNIDATLIYISSDYVFDGNKTTPYKTCDKPNPINIYGYTKYQGEIEVKKELKKYYIVRTAWLYGINKDNFINRIIYKAKKGETIKAAINQIGCPTSSKDLSIALINLLNKPYGTYHLCSSGNISRYELIKTIFQKLNLKNEIIPLSLEDFNLNAKRPCYCAMDNDGLMRDWKDMLLEYLEIIN